MSQCLAILSINLLVYATVESVTYCAQSKNVYMKLLKIFSTVWRFWETVKDINGAFYRIDVQDVDIYTPHVCAVSSLSQFALGFELLKSIHSKRFLMFTPCVSNSCPMLSNQMHTNDLFITPGYF